MMSDNCVGKMMLMIMMLTMMVMAMVMVMVMVVMVVMMRMVMGHCWAGVAISGLITPLNSFHYQWTTQRSRKVNGFDGDDEKMDRTITMT